MMMMMLKMNVITKNVILNDEDHYDPDLTWVIIPKGVLSSGATISVT